ncbi:MAG: GTPase ObgE [Deltaproteobacteria bacterium]|nr:GTPase ObgE [Deltaproteobacteria bacterium]
MGFLDEIVITTRSGDGGRGCVSFRREKYVPKGGPDGGDGGHGGNIAVRATKRLFTLGHYKARRQFAARNGQPGRGSNQTGKSAPDLVLEVPLGTVVQHADTDKMLVDLVRDDQAYLLVRGGKGGKGNQHFATAVNRAPRYAQKGVPGESASFRLSLKFLADIGIIGLPNAGKSTLLSRLSTARPKVNSYPFTTLVPNLGVMTFDIHEPLVIADIPGLIDGASLGKGLGHRFLKHIERTKLLLHVLDITYSSQEDILEDYCMLRREMSAFNQTLLEKPSLVVINKMDLYDSGCRDRDMLAERLKASGTSPIWASALRGQGIRELKEAILNIWTRENENS